MIEIIEAGFGNLIEIQKVAYKTWPVTFGNILSKEQLDYMLDMMYSKDSLRTQLSDLKHVFLLAKEEKATLGFLSLEHYYKNALKTKIHKLYVLPDAQGKGAGKKLIENATLRALTNGDYCLTLNVNRNNNAINFYKKEGFDIVGKENIPIGHGFLMEDYIMEKPLQIF